MRKKSSLKKSAEKLQKNRGNIFTLMLGAVGLVATLGYATQTMITGPVKTMATAHNQTMTRYSMRLAAQLVIAATALNSTADCDADTRVEVLPYKTGTGPTGGGQIPDNVTTQNTDPWGNVYGYCSWDLGTTFDDAACGGPGAKRLNGNDDPVSGNVETQTVFALVSSGPNRQFETTCANYSNGTTPVVTRGGDDAVLEYTYMEAGAASFGSSGSGSLDGVWNLKSGDPTVAETSKKLEIGSGGASINISAGSGVFDKVTANGLLTAAGGHQLGPATGFACDAIAKTGTLRYSPAMDAVQFCSQPVIAYEWETIAKGTNGKTTTNWTFNESREVSQEVGLIFDQNATAVPLKTAGPGVRMVWYPDKVAFRSGLAKGAYWDDANIGLGSIAIGARTWASGTGSIAIGGDPAGGTNPAGTDGPVAIGKHAIAIGVSGTSSGISSITIGKNVTALGNGSVAIGENNLINASGAAGRGSVAMGYTVSVAGTRSTALGSYISVNANQSFGVGLSSTNLGHTLSENNTFAMVGGRLIFYPQAAAKADSLLEVYGDGPRKTGGGAWLNWSDGRLKNIVADFGAGLDTVRKINPYRFNFRKDNIVGASPEKERQGFVAQNIENALPDATFKSDSEFYSLDFDPIIYAGINAVKDLKARNERLELRAQTLRKDIARLEGILSENAQKNTKTAQ